MARDIADHLDDRFRCSRGASDGPWRAIRPSKRPSLVVPSSRRRRPAAARRTGRVEGPFTVHDAVGIASGDADEVDVLNRLSSLVDRSMVVHSHEPEPYRMLETVRAYGRLRLDAEGQSEATRARHARHFRDRSRTLSPAAWTADEPIVRRQILVQAADYLAAARWARDAGDLDLAAELVPAIADLTLDRRCGRAQASSWRTWSPGPRILHRAGRRWSPPQPWRPCSTGARSSGGKPLPAGPSISTRSSGSLTPRSASPEPSRATPRGLSRPPSKGGD